MNLFRGLILIVFSVAMALAIVWERAQVTRIRYEIGAMEREIAELEHEEQTLRLEVSLLKSPRVIADRACAMDLGLSDPSGSGKALKEKKGSGEYKLIAMRAQE